MRQYISEAGFQSRAKGYAPPAIHHHGQHAVRNDPLPVVFALLGRQIVGGIMQGAVKG